MVLDRSDVRSTMASYGASTRPTPTDFVACEYVRFYDSQPQEITADGSRAWYCRGQNFVLAYTQVESGVEFTRTNQPDEYTVFVPDRDGPSLDITAGSESANVPPYSIAFVPPGASRITVTGKGQVVRLFSVLAEDLVAKCSNAASYAQPHPNVAPLGAWPAPADGFKLRVYSLDVPKDPTRFGTIFRSTNIMVNYGEGSVGPRDTRRMSPHSHDDFEQCSLVLQGEYVHHIRLPWTANLEKWIEDDHTRIGSPSVAIIPPPSIHTSQALGSGRNQLIDIFSPPRFDLSERAGWVLNAADYPMPSREPGA